MTWPPIRSMAASGGGSSGRQMPPFGRPPSAFHRSVTAAANRWSATASTAVSRTKACCAALTRVVYSAAGNPAA
jgi:hypothetical protein